MGSLQTAILQSKEASFNIQLRLQKVYQIFKVLSLQRNEKNKELSRFSKACGFLSTMFETFLLGGRFLLEIRVAEVT